MTHARPVLVSALRAWWLTDAAAVIDRAASLRALRMAVMDADAQIRASIVLRPLRRDLSNAATTLQTAITFASRGDAENTSAVVIGVFTHAASALSWQRPWTRWSWRWRRTAVIAGARREQQQYLAQFLVTESGQSQSGPG